jgi:hypothetical protein
MEVIMEKPISFDDYSRVNKPELMVGRIPIKGLEKQIIPSLNELDDIIIPYDHIYQLQEAAKQAEIEGHVSVGRDVLNSALDAIRVFETYFGHQIEKGPDKRQMFWSLGHCATHQMVLELE